MNIARSFSATLCAALWLIIVPTTAGAVTLSLEPPATVVQVGGTFDIAVTISDLGDGFPPSVSAFDLVIDYAPGFLSAAGVSFGDPVLGDQLGLSFLPLTAEDLSVPGAAAIAELSFDFPFDLIDFQAPAFTLATIEFMALAATPGGIPTFLSVDPLPGGLFGVGALVLDAFGDPLPDVALVGAEVIVEPRAIPEPGTLALLSIGIVGLAARRRGAAR
jgi:hypothetical protein